MELAVGSVLEGKVTGITKFGAFVSLPGGKTGMVHISEGAHVYVRDINEHLTIGQQVKVKVIAVDPAGKVNLSIKKTTAPPPRQPRQGRQENRNGDRGDRQQNRGDRQPRPNGDNRRQGSNGSRQGGNAPRNNTPKEPATFDDMLKQFMADSDSKISSIRQYSDHRTKSKRRQ